MKKLGLEYSSDGTLIAPSVAHLNRHGDLQIWEERKEGEKKINEKKNEWPLFDPILVKTNGLHSFGF